jgi:hypothetical protein
VPDGLVESRRVTRPYCPTCEPAADPIRELLDVRWCEAHLPARDGLDDQQAQFETSGLANTEATGEDNRRWCDLLHREAPYRRAGRRPRRAAAAGPRPAGPVAG